MREPEGGSGRRLIVYQYGVRAMIMCAHSGHASVAGALYRRKLIDASVSGGLMGMDAGGHQVCAMTWRSVIRRVRNSPEKNEDFVIF